MAKSSSSAPVIRSGIGTFNSLKGLLLNTRILWVPTNNAWTATVTGSGTSAQYPTFNTLTTGVTASSTALMHSQLVFHDAGAATGINFTKRVLWAFSIRRASSDTEVVARVQLKNAQTAGTLAAGGIGIQISNLTLVGEGYGSAQAVTGTLATLTANQIYNIVVVCDQPNSKIDFYVNQVLAGSITAAANIPSGNIAARQLNSIIRGATGATDSSLESANILVATEY